MYCREISHTHRRLDDVYTAAATATTATAAVPAALCISIGLQASL